MTKKLMLGYNQIVSLILEYNRNGISEKEIQDLLMSKYDIPNRIKLPNLIYQTLNEDLGEEEE